MTHAAHGKQTPPAGEIGGRRNLPHMAAECLGPGRAGPNKLRS